MLRGGGKEGFGFGWNGAGQEFIVRQERKWGQEEEMVWGSRSRGRGVEYRILSTVRWMSVITPHSKNGTAHTQTQLEGKEARVPPFYSTLPTMDKKRSAVPTATFSTMSTMSLVVRIASIIYNSIVYALHYPNYSTVAAFQR